MSAFRTAVLLLFAVTPIAAQRATTGTVYGTVRDSGGVAVAGAQVRVLPAGGAALTDSAGRYRLVEVPTGRVTVHAARIGFNPRQLVVQLAAGTFNI